MTKTLIRAAVLHFPKDTQHPERDFQYHSDGALVFDSAGIILAVGDYPSVKQSHGDAAEQDHRGRLLLPGLIDSHLHFPQTEMIARFGKQLLDWLENYTFPTERKFAESAYADKIAQIFLQQLFRHGTTTGLVYSSVHKQAADSLFSAAQQHNMALIAGKVCMDRNCPDYLQDTAATAQQDSAELIQRWHGNGRLQYAITPRFAPTSTPEQLHGLQELAQQYPDVFIQTHLSENRQEVEWVKSLYPNASSYLDVYHQYDLVRPRAVYGHCIYLEPQEWELLADTGASIAFCPTSNLFLGSGLFDLAKAQQQHIHVTLATDVGGGTSFSMLKTLGEAYKICQLQDQSLHALNGLYLMTQGSASALGLSDTIGNLNPGSHADFLLLDPQFDALTELRINADLADPADVIFALSMLGDDRATHSTWIAGQPVYQQPTTQEM